RRDSDAPGTSRRGRLPAARRRRARLDRRSRLMRILWLKSDLLLPLDKGGKLRTWHLMRHLAKHHEITYLAFAEPATGSARETTAAPGWLLRLLGALRAPGTAIPAPSAR